ncbi:Antagonist of MEN (Mitotic Exit Network) [Mucor velutinosus]|uniref:Antagonist of MEN (Mitotic Exit Network) n=1 Tax=Mucor velutinosus TaxID=708070 RepID=A0AAN7HSK4_9FUNG|nr:Antagonist of MEN (Mitotic Exit Network) [Mucor velutinosus]
MLEPQEATSQNEARFIDSKAQDAFMKATTAAPLPTFSLPSNLNDKLATNKQKAAATATRPRLSNLRSIWLSQQSFEEDAFADDKVIDIQLPSIPTLTVKYTSVLREISVLATVATLLCVSSAAYLALLKPTASAFHSLLLGGWMLLLVWFMLGDCRSDNMVHSLVYFRYSAIVMLVVTGWSHNETALPIVLSCVLFYIGERLSIAYKQLQTEMMQLQTDQQTTTQQAIDRALEDYSDKRTMFLSTVSQEMRDAALMVIATLEQFSPCSILSNTHELLSACSIAVPIASISAINTTIKQACHISSHLNLVARMLRDSTSLDDTPEQERVKSNVSQDFDVGELLQNVGDALAGMSAKLGVHFIIYHMDNGLYYPNVIGDEDAIKHALINLLRNLLEGCTPGARIELGLYIASIPETPKVKVIFDIVQVASPAIPAGLSSGALIPNANFTARLLDYIGGKMELEDLGKNKTRVEVSLELYPGRNSDQKLLLIEKPSQILEKQLSNIRFSNEPTLEDLSMFINNLKGVKIILYAPERSIFAKHLTSCLTGWNTDISHLPVLMTYNGDEEETLQQNETVFGSDSEVSSVSSQQPPIKTPLETIQANLSPASNRSIGSDISKKVPSPAIEEDHIHSIPPTFILIDDDIMTLEKKLREFRDKPVVPATEKHHHPSQSRRHRRSRSRQGGTAENLSAYGTVAVIFFTSLNNYKRVRDTIHWFSSLTQTPYMPRVVVVPKPAGPRRFLTALHTAWNNAIVDPQFIPIATSPLSPFAPSLGSMSSLYHHQHHYSPAESGSNSTTGTSTAVTPGIGAQPPLMTPHDMNRFSPGRRTISTARGLHSPSNLQMESEKTNYFFDSSRPTGPNLPAKLNTSPLLTAVNTNNMISSPVSNPPLATPGSANGTKGSVSSSSSAGSNATPSEIKRRLRSHSSTFMVPSGRRTLVDLSLSPTSSPHGIAGKTTSSPVTEATEQEEQDAIDAAAAAAAASPPLNFVSPSSILKSINQDQLTPSTNEEGGSGQQSSMELPVMPTHAQILTSRSNKNSNASVVEPLKAARATLSPPLPPPSASPISAVITDESMPPTASPSSIASNATTTAVSTPISAAVTPPPPSATTTTTKPKSKFNFKISNRKRKEKTSSPGKQSPPITVLIVEDNMINQAILSTWMKKHSIKFSVASDGKEAVEKWKGGSFHLILMDIQLPVMDGIAATKMIRSIEKERKIGVLPSNATTAMAADQDTAEMAAVPEEEEEEEEEVPSKKKEDEEEEKKKIKKEDIEKESPTPSASSPSNVSSFQSPVIIVALTASSLESDRQAALAAGCNDFLTKPVSLEWLEKKIMEWGCMQALIDFEGWRKWKRSAASTKSAKSSNPAAVAEASKQAAFAATAAATAATKNGLAAKIMTKEATEAMAHEKEMLALRTKEMLKDESKGIILVGIHKRRMSTVVSSSTSMFDDRSIVITRADSSSRSSTPPLQHQPPLSASPTRTTFHHSGHHRLRKRTSDPDMYTHEMSIPKQVEAREHKRILEQQRLLQQWEHEQEDDDDLSTNSSEP